MTRQYTQTIFLVKKHKNTGMMCQLIKNKKDGKPFDVVKFTILPLEGKPLVFNASPEEALEIAWGMIKTVYHFLNNFEPYRIWRSKGTKYKWTKKRIWWKQGIS